MRLANRPDGFGPVTRLLHWGMAAGILGMLAFGLTLVRMRMSLATVWLFGLHKSIGITLLALALLRLLWHRVSPPPGPLGGVPAAQLALARWTHRALYLLMLAVPLSGWAGSAATGIDVVVFNTLTLPPIVPPSEAGAKALLTLHHWLTWALMGLLALHVAGALKRSVLARDGTLSRMVLGRR
ncbi:MAG: cytochrome b [Rhodobacteraceae bacterium]|nr:cytochrome b [Paracoccaceae bacterium]